MKTDPEHVPRTDEEACDDDLSETDRSGSCFDDLAYVS